MYESFQELSVALSTHVAAHHWTYDGQYLPYCISRGDHTLQASLSSLSMGSIIEIVVKIIIGLCYIGLVAYLMWYPVPVLRR
eukprot:jgi/Galph1/3344/GphlegSOOS_G2062.1